MIDLITLLNELTSYEFEKEYIGAANRFHNRFIGAEEYQNAQEEHFYINERYSATDQGAIIVDLALEGSKRLSFTHLPDGYYFDQITGKQVHIRNGSAKITFDASGVSVLTKTNNAPRASITSSNYGGSIPLIMSAGYSKSGCLHFVLYMTHVTFLSSKKYHIKY